MAESIATGGHIAPDPDSGYNPGELCSEEMLVKIQHYTEVQAEDAEGLPGVKVRWVIAERDGAENFAMRVFELSPGANTPLHSHPWEHEVFILEGEGMVLTSDRERSLAQGDVVFVLPEEEHRFRNTGAGTLRFICLIPILS